MKSENHLILTGIVVSVANPQPGQSLVRFRIVHNFGGGRKPLTLDCIQIAKPNTETRIPQKGNFVRLRAYLRMRAESIEAVVKSMDIEP